MVLSLVKNPLVEICNLSSIRIIISGAAPLGEELVAALQRLLPQAILGQFNNFEGLRHDRGGSRVSMCPAFAKRPMAAKSGSCGTVVRNAELKVIDPSTGYLNEPNATSATTDMDGWLHTGTLVMWTSMMRQKDEVAGEVPIAFVVRSDLKLNEVVVREFISKQVVYYKRLHKVYFVDVIQRSSAGKILKKDLRARPNSQNERVILTNSVLLFCFANPSVYGLVIHDLRLLRLSLVAKTYLPFVSDDGALRCIKVEYGGNPTFFEVLHGYSWILKLIRMKENWVEINRK
ncbi:hypothetical protein HPP92_020893 [Vanilla planifolia]|uniref:AMP-binding enzyme C-terminal domain-containing protein n=1 Tax=Vanilla planifolia TaxID=51239 RepID=A0A835PUF4_VANPL|nr:hypothetical protein HPP92_020893 [Vanilla planifolia]